MHTKMRMIYWKGDKLSFAKLLEHPDIITQGETLEELEENMKDAYRMILMEHVPQKHQIKERGMKRKELVRQRPWTRSWQPQAENPRPTGPLALSIGVQGRA